jgi:hypothetical protein
MLEAVSDIMWLICSTIAGVDVIGILLAEQTPWEFRLKRHAFGRLDRFANCPRMPSKESRNQAVCSSYFTESIDSGWLSPIGLSLRSSFTFLIIPD